MEPLILFILCAAFGVLIVIAHLTMYAGLLISGGKARGLKKRSGDFSVAVVVPARNEEKLLPRLLDSFEGQTDRNFEIILVNDRSTDSTGEIMTDFSRKMPDRVKVVHISEDPDIKNPKLSALIQGVDRADAEVLMFTDADCYVPPDWVKKVSSCFAKPDVGVIFAPIETRKEGTLISVFHAFDHIFKYSYNAGCAGIGMPTGGFGNNLAVRKQAIDDIGGLRSIQVTSTEDAALISQIRADTNWETRALFSRDVTVFTEAQKTWRALTEQETRWHTGGLFSPDIQTRLAYSFIMFYLTASVLAIPICFAVPILWMLPIVSCVTMSMMAIISGALTSQPVLSYWFLLLPFILLSMGYNSFLTIRALLKPHLTWKGTELDF